MKMALTLRFKIGTDSPAGTLTKNQMTVTSVGFVDRLMTAEEALESFQTGKPTRSAMKDLHRAATVCNEASFAPETLHKPVQFRKQNVVIQVLECGINIVCSKRFSRDEFSRVHEDWQTDYT